MAEKQDDLGKMIVVAAFLLAAGTVLGCYYFSKANFAPNVSVGTVNSNQNNGITVTGTTTQNVNPDLLKIDLHVQSQANDARLAQQNDATAEAQVLAKLKSLGISDQDIQTTYYDLQPVQNSQYVCTNQSDSSTCTYTYVTTGYTATQGLEVNVNDLKSGGNVIDAVSSVGTNQTFVDSVSFTLKDATRAQMTNALLQNASMEAKAKAQTIAQGLGATLGKITSASETSNSPRPVYYSSYALSAAPSPQPAQQLSPGQVQISASVSVTYSVQ